MEEIEYTKEILWPTPMCDYLLSYINLMDTKTKNVFSGVIKIVFTYSKYKTINPYF